MKRKKYMYKYEISHGGSYTILLVIINANLIVVHLHECLIANSPHDSREIACNNWNGTGKKKSFLNQ